MKQFVSAGMLTYVCLGMSVMVFSYFEIDDADQNLGYENTIVAFDELTTATGYKIILTFEQDNPISVYAPESFEESCDTTVHRILIPQTTLAGDIDSDLVSQIDGDVEIVLTGRSFKKIISGNMIVFVVYI